MKVFTSSMLFALLFLTAHSQTALTVKKVIVCEYHSFYIASDGNVYAFLGGFGKAVPFPINGRKAIDGAGGFNVFRVLDDQGYIWSSKQDLTTNTVRFDTDTTGAAFSGNTAIYAYANTSATIRSDGSVWYFGDDTFHLFHTKGRVNMRPTRLSPAGIVVKKLAMGGNRIVALTTSGQVYEWVYGASRTPALKTIPRPAIDIFASHLDYAGCIIPATIGATGGYPYVWGSSYGCWGGNAVYTQPTSVQALWKVVTPIMTCDANWNTTHYIDISGHMFGMGFNAQGEVGNGTELVNKYTYPTFPGYGWDFGDGEYPTGAPPVEIGAGIKWSQLFSNNWFSYYKFALDINGNLYSWGRNKAMDLGNGFLNLQEAAHPNALDVLVPTLVHPLTAAYQAYNWTGPSISAGPNQTVATSSVVLTGTATAPQLIKSTAVAANGIDKIGYNIVSYQWTKVSGTGGTIASPNSAITTVTGLTTGTYVFNLKTTDNNTGTQSANVTITVNSVVSGSLVASAGSSQTITLPANSVTLAGSGTSPKGAITSYAWTKVSGPAQYAISNAAVSNPLVSNLVAGSYVFRLTVKDITGASTYSDVTITVNAAVVNSNSKLIPGKIEAESYDAKFNVATQSTTDVYGGLNVDYISNGSWMNYNVNVSTAGTYTVSFRVATANANTSFQLRNSAGTILAKILLIQSTGGYQTWQTVSTTVVLPAGNQTLQILSTSSSYWNINWMSFLFSTPVGQAAVINSGSQQVATLDPKAQSDAIIPASLAIYPNPAKDQFTLDITNSHMGTMTVQVLNLSGAVMTTYSENKSLQNSRVTFPVNNLAGGTYFVRVQIGTWTETKKLLKL